MLSLKNVVVHYGGVQALKGVSMESLSGTITTLIGANGAGKSTTLRAISGLTPLTDGEIWFRNQRIDGFDPEEIVDLGIGHVPEGKKLFLEMSVQDNLLTGAYLRRDKKAVERDIEKVCTYFPVLDRAYSRPAAQMSGGEQQMLAIARGLMNDPQMLLLDEPSLGLSPLLTREVGGIVRRIAEEGMTILLIEQNASLALRLAKKCYVLETGQVVLEGESEELRNNRHVKAAYLGIDPEVEDRTVTEDSIETPTTTRPQPPEEESSVYENTLEPVGRVHKRRLPPEAPPVLGELNIVRGLGDEKSRLWDSGDPDPTSLRPKGWQPPASNPYQHTAHRKSTLPEETPAVIKKIFKPRQG
jgi:branched-chain amino acid transport system ATP-binding protein